MDILLVLLKVVPASKDLETAFLIASPGCEARVSMLASKCTRLVTYAYQEYASF